MNGRVVCAFAVPIVLACASQAQESVSTSSSSSGHVVARVGFAGPAFAPPPITGAPYSAEQVMEHTQTLADGAHISQKILQAVMYRDSQGRTRTERPMMPQSNSDMRMIEIVDPVAGFRYTLDPANKTAHRVKLQSPPGASGSRAGGPWLLGYRLGATAPVPSRAVASRGDSKQGLPDTTASANRPESRSESLGTQTMEGVLAEGHRTTVTYPVGMEGNDRPLVTTMESWFSADLQLMVLSKNSDPRSGETITRLTNLSRAEPDPALFLPPADYQVIDENGPFSVEMKRP